MCLSKPTKPKQGQKTLAWPMKLWEVLWCLGGASMFVGLRSLWGWEGREERGAMLPASLVCIEMPEGRGVEFHRGWESCGLWDAASSWWDPDTRRALHWVPGTSASLGLVFQSAFYDGGLPSPFLSIPSVLLGPSNQPRTHPQTHTPSSEPDKRIVYPRECFLRKTSVSCLKLFSLIWFQRCF